MSQSAFGVILRQFLVMGQINRGLLEEQDCCDQSGSKKVMPHTDIQKEGDVQSTFTLTFELIPDRKEARPKMLFESGARLVRAPALIQRSLIGRTSVGRFWRWRPWCCDVVLRPWCLSSFLRLSVGSQNACACCFSYVRPAASCCRHSVSCCATLVSHASCCLHSELCCRHSLSCCRHSE